MKMKKNSRYKIPIILIWIVILLLLLASCSTKSIVKEYYVLDCENNKLYFKYLYYDSLKQGDTICIPKYIKKNKLN